MLGRVFWSASSLWVLVLLSQNLQAASLPAADNTIKFQQRLEPRTECPDRREIFVEIQGVKESPMKLTLQESSRDFLHSDARPDNEICFYQGSIEDDEAALVAAVQRNNLLSGAFHFRDATYEIPPQPAGSSRFSASIIPAPREPRRCGLASNHSNRSGNAQLWPPASSRSRPRRAAAVLMDTHSDVPALDRKYIRLILIGDQYFYSQMRNDSAAALSRLWEVGNYVNAFYKQLGVSVITVYAEVWQTDPYVTHSASSLAGANSTEMLNNFMDYKMRRLNSRPHSAAQLVSGLRMTGSDVGLAHLGKLCHSAFGGGVNSDRDPNAISVAITVAHELGHNLGMNHDEDETGCHCPDRQGCIMAAVGSEINPVRFSNCSVFRYQDFSVDNGLGYCMSDPPTQADLIAARSTCGNRIVEPGEDCDCGPARWCNNSCCNPSTCKFSSGAVCASGECCNITSCRLRPQGVVCRPRKQSCDLEEYCNGTSEWCPEFDDHMIDGSECLSGQAYCYRGRCSDRNTRCSVMFNATDFRAAPAFYSAATIQGSPLGYCSYSMIRFSPLEYNYSACSPDNQRCGVLYCTSNLAAGEPVPVWKGAAFSDARVLEGTINYTNVIAAFMHVDLSGSGYRDPGLVPNGAECGIGRMCVNSECVAINNSRCPNCNGNGWCTQSGQCFCSPGFAPPSCLLPGTGGSLTNHPPSPATTTSSTPLTTTTAPTTPTTTTATTTTPTTTTPTTTTPTTTTPTTITPTTTTSTTTTPTTTTPTSTTTTTTTPTTTTPTTTTPTTTTPTTTTSTTTTPTTTTPTSTTTTTTTPTTTTPTTTTSTTTTPTTTTPTTTTPTTTTPTTTTPTTTTITTTTQTTSTPTTPQTTTLSTSTIRVTMPSTLAPTTTTDTAATSTTTIPRTTAAITAAGRTSSTFTITSPRTTPEHPSSPDTTTTAAKPDVTVLWPREAAYPRCSLWLSLLSPTITVLLATGLVKAGF